MRLHRETPRGTFRISTADHDFVPASKQRRHRMASDKTRAAQHQDAHRCNTTARPDLAPAVLAVPLVRVRSSTQPRGCSLRFASDFQRADDRLIMEPRLQAFGDAARKRFEHRLRHEADMRSQHHIGQ